MGWGTFRRRVYEQCYMYRVMVNSELEGWAGKHELSLNRELWPWGQTYSINCVSIESHLLSAHAKVE